MSARSAPRLKPAVIGVSGNVASGKTVLSRAIADTLGWRWGSFGDEVRRLTRERGLDADNRLVLREVGQTLVETAGEGFCRAVLERAGWHLGEGVVLDGVRHATIVFIVRRLVEPMPFRLVLVTTPETVREERLAARRAARVSEPSRADIDYHATERDVSQTLPSLADVIVDGGVDMAQLVKDVLQRLSRPGTCSA